MFGIRSFASPDLLQSTSLLSPDNPQGLGESRGIRGTQHDADRLWFPLAVVSSEATGAREASCPEAVLFSLTKQLLAACRNETEAIWAECCWPCCEQPSPCHIPSPLSASLERQGCQQPACRPFLYKFQLLWQVRLPSLRHKVMVKNLCILRTRQNLPESCTVPLSLV